MDGSTTLTIRLDAKVKKKLGRLAESTDRSKSWLAARAIADYVAYESEIVAGIKRGLADMKAGQLVPHDVAMARLRSTVDTIAQKKRSKR